MDRIRVNVERPLGDIDRNLFGGFVEHLGRCVYGGIYEPGSPRSDAAGIRTDVLDAARRLRYANIRYPGGNYVSAYRWRDGVGPVEERPARYDPAWDALEPNTFGTNEFATWCRRLGAEPYLVVNCGDGDMREARDWVEYCNSTSGSALARMRAEHGYPEPHRVRYWGVGNEVDGDWQVGFKTPTEYARDYLEFAKVMRWADPSIKLIASAISDWQGLVVERAQAIVEQAPNHVDYLSIHWYVGNHRDDLAEYLAVSELLEDRLASLEGLSRALTLRRDRTGGHRQRPPIPIAVDEWNVWYRATPDARDPAFNGLEETYDLADALVVAMHLNAFIRHCRSVKMANLAQLVNVIAPMVTTPDDLLLQTTYFPFELYSTTAGPVAIDAWASCDTFSGGGHAGVPFLDVSATLDEGSRSVSVFAVNRRPDGPSEVELVLDGARFGPEVEVRTIAGPDAGATNTWEDRTRVSTKLTTRESGLGSSMVHALPPHSATGFRFDI